MKRMYNGVEVTFTNETDYLLQNTAYLITFPDGKYYVGSTTQRLTKRISSHCAKSITQNKQYLMSFAIREFMKFDVKILDIENDKTKLRKLEEFYTIEYKSNENEYGYNWKCGNITLLTEETKLKISESHRGHPFSDDFNNHFRSFHHASEYYKCSQRLIWYTLKSGKKSKKLGTGFHY